MTRIKRILLAVALLAAFGVGQAQAITMSTDEATIRNRLVACAAVDEAVQRHISLTRIRVTVLQCSLLH